MKTYIIKTITQVYSAYDREEFIVKVHTGKKLKKFRCITPKPNFAYTLNQMINQ